MKPAPRIVALATLAAVLAIALIDGHRDASAARESQPAAPFTVPAGREGYVVQVHDIRPVVRDAMAFSAALNRIAHGDKPQPAPPPRPRNTGCFFIESTLDMTSGPAVGEAIAEMITEMIDIESWTRNGGAFAQIHHWSGHLIVTQTPENQRRIAELLRSMAIRADGQEVRR